MFNNTRLLRRVEALQEELQQVIAIMIVMLLLLIVLLLNSLELML